MKTNKQFAIAVLWTVIAIIIALFLYLRRERTPSPRVAVTQAEARPVSPEPLTKKIEGFVLVTLNGILISTDTMELIPGNVSSFRKLVEIATKKTWGLVVLYTIPDELIDETTRDVPETISSDLKKLLDQAGLFDYGLKPHRIVFTQTTEGRISVGRQMQAHLFIDIDDHVVTELSGKVPNVVRIDSTGLKNLVSTSPLFSS